MVRLHVTFSFTGVGGAYLANTDSNSAALLNFYEPSNASDADVTNPMDTSNAHPTNSVDVGTAANADNADADISDAINADNVDAINADNADADNVDAIDADNADANNSDAIDADHADADAIDAHAFQQLSQGDLDLMSTNATEIAVDRPSDVLEVPAEQSIEFNSHFSDTSLVVVDVFPFGKPGAPIPGVPQGRSSYDVYQATQGGNWAPFQSQRDWDVARWAKMHGTTSSAVADLFAIPEVCADQWCHPLCPLFTTLGPRYARAFISHSQGTERFH